MRNYYVSSFVWGVLSKILKALFGLVSVPLLLKCFNIEDYGVLTLATSVNAYMHLLDLGMNTGSIKFFSQWLYEGEKKLLDCVARTNLSFYGIIGIINAGVLVFVSFFGRSFFNISDEQFVLLQKLLWITAFFSIFNWLSAVFSQLLTAAQKIAFVHKMMCLVTVLKIGLVYITLFFKISVICYFFFFSLFLSLLIIPYAFLCKNNKLIFSLVPSFEWKKFSIVFSYSLSIFILNFFQGSAITSRPIILGMFANSAAIAVAHYNIVQLMPAFIVSISGILSSLLLPKASVIAKKDNPSLMAEYLQKGTKVSSILSVCLCVPIALCSKGLLAFVVGPEYIHLQKWLFVMIVAIAINLPTTTYYSMVLAIGKTRKIVQITAIFCMISILLNAFLAPQLGVGSAALAYLIFVIGICVYNFVAYYPNLFNLKTGYLIKPIIKPFIFGCIPAVLMYYFFSFVDYSSLGRLECFGWSSLISILWLITYVLLLIVFKEVSIRDLKKGLK